MEPLKLVILIATVIGFLATAGGLISAFLGAKREFRIADERIGVARRLSAQEEAESKADLVDSDETAAAIHAKYTKLYEDADLMRPSYVDLAYLGAFESKRLLGLVLSGTRSELLVAGLGLLVSTLASIASLFLT